MYGTDEVHSEDDRENLPRQAKVRRGKYTKSAGPSNCLLTTESLQEHLYDYDFIDAPPIDQVAMMNGVAWGTCHPAE